MGPSYKCKRVQGLNINYAFYINEDYQVLKASMLDMGHYSNSIMSCVAVMKIIIRIKFSEVWGANPGTIDLN